MKHYPASTPVRCSAVIESAPDVVLTTPEPAVANVTFGVLNAANQRVQVTTVPAVMDAPGYYHYDIDTTAFGGTVMFFDYEFSDGVTGAGTGYFIVDP